MMKANRNVNRLLKEMKRLSLDVNDNEICKKFETLIKSGTEEDVSNLIITRIIQDPAEVDDKEVPEIYLMYFRHYRFMRKRLLKAEKAAARANDSNASTKTALRKKS